MSQLTSDDILSVANLARLKVDDNLAADYAKDISKILAMMDTLSAVNTDDIKPLANIHEACQELRADVANPNIDRDAFQAVAPSVQDGLYLVPQVIE